MAELNDRILSSCLLRAGEQFSMKSKCGANAGATILSSAARLAHEMTAATLTRLLLFSALHYSGAPTAPKGLCHPRLSPHPSCASALSALACTPDCLENTLADERTACLTLERNHQRAGWRLVLGGSSERCPATARLKHQPLIVRTGLDRDARFRTMHQPERGLDDNSLRFRVVRGHDW